MGGNNEKGISNINGIVNDISRVWKNEEMTKKLKLAHALTESHPVHLAMVEFAKEVNEKTNGKIEVLIFPNGQLGGEREITELMQAGAY